MPDKIINCDKHGQVVVADDWGDTCPICLDEQWIKPKACAVTINENEIAEIIRRSLGTWGPDDEHSLKIHGNLVQIFCEIFTKKSPGFKTREYIDYVYREGP